MNLQLINKDKQRICCQYILENFNNIINNYFENSSYNSVNIIFGCKKVIYKIDPLYIIKFISGHYYGMLLTKYFKLTPNLNGFKINSTIYQEFSEYGEYYGSTDCCSYTKLDKNLILTFKQKIQLYTII